MQCTESVIMRNLTFIDLEKRLRIAHLSMSLPTSLVINSAYAIVASVLQTPNLTKDFWHTSSHSLLSLLLQLTHIEEGLCLDSRTVSTPRILFRQLFHRRIRLWLKDVTAHNWKCGMCIDKNSYCSARWKLTHFLCPPRSRILDRRQQQLGVYL